MSTMNAYNLQSFPPQHLMDFNNTTLLNQLKAQVEYYFDPQNLKNDKFLQSHLNATDHLGAVSINVICSFKKIRQLYSYSRSSYYPHDIDMPADPALLRMALMNSTVVSISHDGMWIIPTPQKDSPTEATQPTVASAPSSPSSSQEGLSTTGNAQFFTIVLQNVPEEIAEAKIMEVLADYNPKSIRQEDGNAWHVNFGRHEDAIAALEAGIVLDGMQVHASLQNPPPSVPVMPLAPAANPPALATNPMMVQYPPHYVAPPPQYGFVPMPYAYPPHVAPQPYHVHPQFYPQPQYRYFAPVPHRQAGVPPPQNVFVRPDVGDSRKGAQSGVPAKPQNGNLGNKRTRNRPQQRSETTASDGRKQNDDGKKQSRGTRNKKRGSPKKIDLSKEHFPALGGKEEAKLPAVAHVQGTGYAQALLGSVKKSNTETREAKELEDKMNDLSLSAFNNEGA